LIFLITIHRGHRSIQLEQTRCTQPRRVPLQTFLSSVGSVRLANSNLLASQVRCLVQGIFCHSQKSVSILRTNTISRLREWRRCHELGRQSCISTCAVPEHAKSSIPTGHYTMRHTGPPNQSKMCFHQSSKKLPSGTSFTLGHNKAPLIVDTPLFPDHRNAYYNLFLLQGICAKGSRSFWSDRDEKISHKEAPKNRY